MSAKLFSNTDTFVLNNGEKIPAVGLGTWRSVNHDDAANAVKVALQNGYRHIDTAAIYGNEEQVGRGIAKSGVPREDIFVTSKLWNNKHKAVSEALEESLAKLKLDYLDLYLMHWPVSTDPETGKNYDDWDFVDTYKEMQKLVEKGKVKSIGVSNFTKGRIQKLLNDKDVVVRPVVNQIEAHPFLIQQEVVEYLNDEGILIEAYSPLGSQDAPLIKNEDITVIAAKHNVDPAQVLISWAVQRGTVVLPKSVTESRIISNLKTFKLPPTDFDLLSDIHRKNGERRFIVPPFYDFSEI